MRQEKINQNKLESQLMPNEGKIENTDEITTEPQQGKINFQT